MIDISIVRMAAIVVCLGGLSHASPAGAISDLGCSAQSGNVGLSCSAGPKLDVTRGPGLCIGQTARFRSRTAPFAAVTMMKPAYQNLCLKADSSASLSHLALQAQP
ncbi:MAG TPA: hypothetical protein VII39_03800 [Bradyrhizobium sp.]